MNAQVNYVYKNEAFTLTLLLQVKVLHPFPSKSVLPFQLYVLKFQKIPRF